MAEITIQTNFSPAVTFDPKTRKQGLSLLSIIQPSVDIDLPVVGNFHYAPYGEPNGFGVFVLIAIAALAIYGAYKIIN